MDNSLSLESNCESSEDIVPIARNVPLQWEEKSILRSAEHPQPVCPLFREKLQEISDDSEEELELAVDAIHPRLSTAYYFCARCKKRFSNKKILYSHFEEGCYVNCSKCGKKVYEKLSGGKEVFLRKCSKRCQPVLINDTRKH